MNLIIDVGNSSVKLAVFHDGELLSKKTIHPDVLIKHVNLLRNEYANLITAIISSVGKLKEHDVNYISHHFKTLELNSKTYVPFNNCYDTPLTLGVDRIALVAAAVHNYPNNNVLIIDAGTCITYDFLTANNNYLGGAISPGLNMRYKSLNSLTANLPLLELKIPENLIGTSTQNAIHSGVVNGVLKEIDGIIEAYKQEYLHLTVILTGGDGNFLSKQLKSSIFANSNFLLEGLNYILQFNSNE